MLKRSHVNPKLEVRLSPKGGRGLFAKAPLKEGEFISESGGCIIGDEAYGHLTAEFGDLAFCIGPNRWLGPRDWANPDWDYLINHSCDPNAVIVNGRPQLLNAWRDIALGEEICLDYATLEPSPDWVLECHCGSTHCRRIITGNDWQIPKLQKKYARYFSQYIEDMIAELNAIKSPV